MSPVSIAAVHRAIEAGAEQFFGDQRADGAFIDRPPGSALGTAGAVAALHAVDPHRSAELIRGGVEWLLRHRNDDGGWGGVAGAESEAVPTSVATAVLRIVGGPRAHAEVVSAGQRALAALGGLAAVTDPAVAHLCRQFWALADLPGAHPLRRLPLEVVLFDRVRRQRISFRTAPFIGLALMQRKLTPSGPLRRLTTRLARPTALRLLEAIHEHEGRTGAFSEDPWPAALVCLGLHHAGAAPHLVAAITDFLRRSVRADGGWDAVTNLDLTRSGFAATGLIAAGYAEDPRLARTREFFHRCQQREAFTVFDCPPGGWSYSSPNGWPVTLESAEILSALAGLPGHETDPVLARGLAWLISRQDTRGSWSLWIRDTKLANDGPCPAITAQGVTALLHAGHTVDSPPVAAALRWLVSAGRADGTFDNLWYRDYTSGTAMVLDALSLAGEADHPVARRARDWLLATRCPDGSWGAGDGGPGSVEETAWAVHALLAAGIPADDEVIERGVAHLVERQLPDGSWPTTRVCAYIRHHMHYANGAITRSLALRALGAYRTAVRRAATVEAATPGSESEPGKDRVR